jgi:hypothetical protein
VCLEIVTKAHIILKERKKERRKERKKEMCDDMYGK